MDDEALVVGPKASWLEANGWQPLEGEGFTAHVGPFWLNTGDRTARLGFIADDRHRNRNGNVQGGMIATLADRAMGQTGRMANSDLPHATIQLDMHYVDAVQIGEFVEARCRVMRRTRSVLFMEAEIMANGRLVATARGIWKVLKPINKQ
jgi:uncharacterized protein (TIGR00369 family)